MTPFCGTLHVLYSGGSRKKYLGGPGPSSFGRQPRLSEITMLNAESARIEAPRGVGFLGGGVGLYPLPSRLGDLGERRELPQRGPGRSPAANTY